MKTKKTNTGIVIHVTQTGHIESADIIAGSDREQAVVEKALSRITRPSCWVWLKRLIITWRA